MHACICVCVFGCGCGCAAPGLVGALPQKGAVSLLVGRSSHRAVTNECFAWSPARMACTPLLGCPHSCMHALVHCHTACCFALAKVWSQSASAYVCTLAHVHGSCLPERGAPLYGCHMLRRGPACHTRQHGVSALIFAHTCSPAPSPPLNCAHADQWQCVCLLACMAG